MATAAEIKQLEAKIKDDVKHVNGIHALYLSRCRSACVSRQ